jgi:PPOX class probable F420-dependent enzyme
MPILRPCVGRGMAVTLNEAAAGLIDGKNFATIATLNADGSPQTSVVWVKRDGDTMAFSTTSARLKARNIARDPRVSVTIFDTANPYRFIEIRGTAQLTEDTSRAFQTEISHKYLGEDPPPDPDGVVRVVVRVIPEKVVEFSA